MATKATYFAVAGIGGLFLWSGIKGKSWSSVFRNLVSGKNPANATDTQQIQPLSTSSGGSYGYGNQSVSVTAPSSPSETAWIQSLLKGLGAPVNNANVESMSSWIAHEGPWGTQGKNNPLNTTLSLPGSSSFDGLAVRNYPTASLGLVATILTLRGGYPDIVSRLKSGQGLCGWSSPEFLKWSGNGYSRVC